MERVNGLARRVPVWAVCAAGALPLALLVWGAMANTLGAEPVKTIEHRLGLLGFQFLLASLAITPLRRLGLNLIRFRRALGLLAFCYVALHLVAWVWLDMGLRWSEMAVDLVKRPYVIAGMVGFVAMLPLALTSTNRAIRAMGPLAWGRLHRLAYVAILAGALHFLLIQKVWTIEIIAYLALTLVLFGARLLPAPRARARAAA